jgi:hypothetical protein
MQIFSAVYDVGDFVIQRKFFRQTLNLLFVTGKGFWDVAGIH